MKIGTPVRFECGGKTHSGVIASELVTVAKDVGPRRCYAVELDAGFYNPDKSIYTSTMLVHEDYLVAA